MLFCFQSQTLLESTLISSDHPRIRRRENDCPRGMVQIYPYSGLSFWKGAAGQDLVDHSINRWEIVTSTEARLSATFNFHFQASKASLFNFQPHLSKDMPLAMFRARTESSRHLDSHLTLYLDTSLGKRDSQARQPERTSLGKIEHLRTTTSCNPYVDSIEDTSREPQHPFVYLAFNKLAQTSFLNTRFLRGPRRR
jgi:hypothetical protein